MVSGGGAPDQAMAQVQPEPGAGAEAAGETLVETVSVVSDTDEDEEWRAADTTEQPGPDQAPRSSSSSSSDAALTEHGGAARAPCAEACGELDAADDDCDAQVCSSC